MPSNVNTQFSLAVHMLTLLGRRPGVMQPSGALAGSAGASPVHVRRVLGRLRRAGLVRSRNGPGGGWLVEGEVCAITLDVVWAAIHGDGPVLGLHEASPDCETGQQIQDALGALDRRAAAALVAELERTTVGDLVDATVHA
ncbi:Putative HTH-type transcriptional regulator YwnA [Paraconexibacter sp. AEG42_29]|uniref:HTH-type transcriptional regulator YwnA n=1 Tax=Paraconexibacter sp. AEG42_29 TaxID=2997339 RepID=A0AAU7APB2_9ACTN